jgi:hypothetical protein
MAHPHAETISLTLTPFVLTACVAVVAIYLQTALNLLFSARQWQPKEILITGIVVSFIGKFADNAFWLIPWLSKYCGSAVQAHWFDLGPAMNIFSRQGCTIVAAICHVYAAYRMTDRMPWWAIAIAFVCAIGWMSLVFVQLVAPYSP